VTGTRRLSQAISEGDGISILVEVPDAAAAKAAEQQGAEGIVVRSPAGEIRAATALPVVWNGSLEDTIDADAVVVDVDAERERLADVIDEVHSLGVECVLRVRDEDDLEHVLEVVDPEILLLSAEEADDDQLQLDRLLELLPDVPAGKLAIAELVVASRHEIAELERAGVDAVLVTAGDIAPLVRDAPPEV
jgi:indole-3-glycerol phosphate synthase